MLYCMAGVRQQDMMPNQEVAERCIKKLEAKIRQERFLSFCHVRQAGEDTAVNVVENLEDAGRRPVI